MIDNTIDISVDLANLIKGDKGDTGATPDITMSATVDETTGTPAVSVTKSGTDEAPNFELAFTGLKGTDGIQGKDGEKGADGKTPDITISASVDDTSGTPNVTVTKSGTVEEPIFDLAFRGLKGEDAALPDELKADITANTAARHTHNNKDALDSITSSKINEWDSKSDFSGNYNDLTNKPTIPTVPTAEIEANTAARHTHDNKTVLDGITAAKVSAWDNKSDFDGKYTSLTDKPFDDVAIEVNADSVDTSVPSAKAVYTAIQENGGSAIFDATYANDSLTLDEGATFAALTDAYNAGKACYLRVSGIDFLGNNGAPIILSLISFVGGQFAAFDAANFAVSIFALWYANDVVQINFNEYDMVYVRISSIVSEIEDNSTVIPSAKAVYDYVQSVLTVDSAEVVS